MGFSICTRMAHILTLWKKTHIQNVHLSISTLRFPSNLRHGFLWWTEVGKKRGLGPDFHSLRVGRRKGKRIPTCQKQERRIKKRDREERSNHHALSWSLQSLCHFFHSRFSSLIYSKLLLSIHCGPCLHLFWGCKLDTVFLSLLILKVYGEHKLTLKHMYQCQNIIVWGL